MKTVVERADIGNAREVTVLTGEFVSELINMRARANFHFNHEETEHTVRERLERSEYVTLIARSVRGHPLGYLVMFEVRTPYISSPFAWLDQFYVRPDYRRRRVARRLIEQARREARKQDWRYIQLAMPAYFQLPAAERVFAREGFTDAGGKKLQLSL